MTISTAPRSGANVDGRDELNLADFPISVLDRRPARTASGALRDQVVYEATAYDPIARRRTPQRVTLTTSSRFGLPTPADENVVLALLHAAKCADGCTGARVHFSPHRLFEVMRWTPNSRSYDRLALVLRRLKSLTIRYENAWWTRADRRYESELATGIIAEYLLVKSRIRRKRGELPLSYVHWSPRFHESLSGGNLKKLDLNLLFGLSTPLAQRLYRFLDKRFYLTPVVELDLRECACGHLGLSPTPNVAELKRRLAPSLAELESIGFLEPAVAASRYLKVLPGRWRIHCRRAGTAVPGATTSPRLVAASEALTPTTAKPSVNPVEETNADADAEARAVLAAYARAWAPDAPTRAAATATELVRARQVIARHGAAEALAMAPRVAALVRTKFPQAKTFGAAVGYFDEAAREAEEHRRQLSAAAAETHRRHAGRLENVRRQEAEDALFALWQPRWNCLAPSQRAAVFDTVVSAHPYLAGPSARGSRVALGLCLEELARRAEASERNDELYVSPHGNE